MATCSYCSDQTSMPFRCKFCEDSFCSRHRLPENHDCQGLEEYRKQSREQGKVGYDVIKQGKRGSRATTANKNTSVIDTVQQQLPSFRTGMDLPVTYILLGIMFGVFALQVMLGRDFTAMFALTPGTILTKPWTLVTSMFLHGGLAHLFVNSIVLASFGTEIERVLGDRKYIGLILAAGITSSIGFALAGVLFNMPMPAVGISGALFGLVGFMAVIRPRTKVLAFFVIPLKIRTAIAGFAVIDLANFITQILHAAGLIGFPGLYAVLLGVQIGSASHLTGLAVGLIYGYYTKDKYRRSMPGSMFGVQSGIRRF